MKYTLKIHEPCHENWAKMTTAERGKFCAVCQKNVYDFTNNSTEEINRFVKQNSNFCGRFTNEQLTKEYNTQPNIGINYKKIGAFLGLASALTIAEPAQAQEPIIVGKPAIIEVPKDTVKTTQPIAEPEKKYIRGVVYEQDNNPFTISGAKIRILDTNIETLTDINGNYELDVSQFKENEIIRLEYSFLNTKTKLVNVKPFSNVYTVNVYLEDNITVMTTGYVVIAKKPSLFKRFLNLFKRKK